MSMKKIIIMFIFILPLVFSQVNDDNTENDPLTLYEGLIILSIISTAILTWRTYFKILPTLKDKSYFDLWKSQVSVGLAIFGLKKFEDEDIQKSIKWIRISFLIFIALIVGYLVSIYYGIDLSR